MYYSICSNLSTGTESQNPLSDADDNASLFKSLGYNTPKYQWMGRIACKAEQWADVKEVTGWAGVLLGDPMRPIWFERSMNNTQWERILGALEQYSDEIASKAMQQMVRALERMAPVGLLRGGYPDEDFLFWFNQTEHNHAQFGICGGIMSVSWIASRIAQVWHHGRVKVVPVETQCFLELTAITLSMS